MQNNAEILRKHIQLLTRKLGVLDTKKAFCCNCTIAQCHAIFEIAKAGTISINDLTHILNVNKSATSRTVDELFNQGYVTREPNPNDRRYVKIQLTAKGIEMYKLVEANSREKFTMILNEIPDYDQEKAIDGIRLITEAIQKCIEIEKDLS